VQQDSAEPSARNPDTHFIAAVGSAIGVIADEGEDAGAGDLDFRGGTTGFFFEGEGSGGGGEVLNGQIEVATELSEDIGAGEVDVDTGTGERGDGVIDRCAAAGSC
jgi:hypothetical protein